MREKDICNCEQAMAYKKALQTIVNCIEYPNGEFLSFIVDEVHSIAQAALLECEPDKE